ncbi:carbohydrate ABC transporter permease [Leadbettera azotonutricia]|uniref:ABC transporter, permease protein n=1 Tax=Leadbettera azotonutricia (strain ATCC BAA-888 / DSM 13862 / ZAS-9) TaxID=545695 RepID=F5Y9X9_LEAAZ|nr:carbohydrate ABC transporter permease [Leadbettera azotonutricia]AEF81088.1 ABC transporter, permease protein [Leadbettera azotonutricia ZAS-9]
MTKKKITIGTIVVYLILIVLCAVWLLPIISTLMVAFKTPAEYINTKFYQPPKGFEFINNLKEVFSYYHLHINFLNSFIYAVSGVIFCILLSSTAAFAVTKLKPRGSFFIFLLIYSGTIFPFQLYLIPLLRTYNWLGIYNTKFGMILLYSAICTPFATFLYRGYFLNLDDQIMQAAMIDGCGPVGIFFRIYQPQLKAPTAVVALFQGMWIWNDLLFGMILSSSEKVRPIMVAVAQSTGTGGGKIPVMMAGVIFTSIPTILLFIALRKYFIKGFSMQSGLE